MNREILFRGKRADNGDWAEGCLLIDYVTGQYFIHANGNSVNESDKVNEEGLLKFTAFEVDPETVCQYTGLPDKNGMKICEEDFVKIDNEWIGRVIWSSTESAFIVFPNDDIEHEIYCLGYYVYEHDIEIIGNFFDTPELLEEGDKVNG